MLTTHTNNDKHNYNQTDTSKQWLMQNKTEFTLLSKTTIIIVSTNIVYQRNLKLLVSQKHMQMSTQEVYYVATACINWH